MIKGNRVSARVSRVRVAATVGHQSKPNLPTTGKEFAR